MELVGYETCAKLIWTLGEGCRYTNTIRKKSIHKSNVNKTSPKTTLGLDCSSHNNICDILSEYLVSLR